MAPPYACSRECGKNIIVGISMKQLSVQRLKEYFIKSLLKWSLEMKNFSMMEFVDSHNCG